MARMKTTSVDRAPLIGDRISDRRSPSSYMASDEAPTLDEAVTDIGTMLTRKSWTTTSRRSSSVTTSVCTLQPHNLVRSD